MSSIIINSVEISKNPVKTSEAFVLKVMAFRLVQETISPQSDLYPGQENCGQTTWQAKLLKP